MSAGQAGDAREVGVNLRVLFITFFVVVIDQVSKIFVKGISIPWLGIDISGMRYGQSKEVFGDFFRITFVENPGMAFGIDVNPGSKLFLSLFSIIASIGIFFYLYKHRNKRFIERAALALILAGAIGNLIDRVFYGIIYGYAPLLYGKVVDFFNVEFFDFTLFGKTFERFPIFNVADSAVTVGVILILLFHKSMTPSLEKPPEEGLSENLPENNSEENIVESEKDNNEIKTSDNSENAFNDEPVEIGTDKGKDTKV